MTRKQQSHGVRKVNLGTGCCIRRLRTASARLVEVGFVTAEPSRNRNSGVTYTIRIDTLRAFAKQFRGQDLDVRLDASGSADRAEKKQTPHRDKTPRPGSEPVSASHDTEALQDHLADLVAQLGFGRLGAPNRNTVANLLQAARSRDSAATPRAVAWFIRNKLVDGGASRFRSWGGLVYALRNDYPATPQGGDAPLNAAASPEQGQLYLRQELDRCVKVLRTLEQADPRRNALEELIAEIRHDLSASGEAV